MQVSENCVRLLKSFNISALKSNVLIADLKTIQYGIVDEKSDPTYEMSDIAFAKWNRSIYQYDKNSSNLVLKRGINVTKDVPRVVRNVVKASSIKNSNVYAR